MSSAKCFVHGCIGRVQTRFCSRGGSRKIIKNILLEIYHACITLLEKRLHSKVDYAVRTFTRCEFEQENSYDFFQRDENSTQCARIYVKRLRESIAIKQFRNYLIFREDRQIETNLKLQQFSVF